MSFHAAIMNSYFNPLRVVTSATNQIDLTFQNWSVIVFFYPLLLVPWALRIRYIILHFYIYILLMKSVFSYDFFLVIFVKMFLLCFSYFQELLTLEPLLSKLLYGSCSAWCGHVLRATSFWLLRPEWVTFYHLFGQSLFICSTFCFIFIRCFSLFCFGCVLSSKVE